MIYISKFRSNDLNPSRGKQIEFNKGVVESFFNFTNEEHAVEFECHSILDAELKEKIRVEFKLSPARGDYKIYQNRDGSRDLKDFLLDTLHLEIEKNINDYFAIKKQSPIKYILYYIPKDSLFSHFFSIASNDQVLFIPDEKEIETLDDRHQVIYYGAPGTGKSHIVKKHTEGESVVRTTFHPDSDYSTFVGCYKPTNAMLPICNEFGVPMKIGETFLYKEQITYEFVAQSFLNAYIEAWLKYCTVNEEKPKKQYLIIEEINRGNCAQIFGDLFQLLDRNDSGFSDYYIHADRDMQKHLAKAFNGIAMNDSHKNTINEMYHNGERDIVAQVLNGEILLLPNNLYIWATMNTSDQSLFPIDSAFKRRWDWEYEPIKYKNTDWIINIQNNSYSWESFQREINKRIFDANSSEDKMLGDYFVNPADGIITEKMLLNKILFYLWNDVCKDGEGDIFKTSATKEISFSELHGDGGVDKLIAMMAYLGIPELDYREENSDTDADNDTKKKLPKYSINGSQELYSTPKAVQFVIEKFAQNNNDMPVDDMISFWNEISERKNCLIASWTPSPNDNQSFANKRRTEIKWGGKSAWVINGWTDELFNTFIKNVREKIGIEIKKAE